MIKMIVMINREKISGISDQRIMTHIPLTKLHTIMYYIKKIRNHNIKLQNATIFIFFICIN